MLTMLTSVMITSGITPDSWLFTSNSQNYTITGSNGRGFIDDFRPSADSSGQKVVRLHLRVADQLRSERTIGM